MIAQIKEIENNKKGGEHENVQCALTSVESSSIMCFVINFDYFLLVMIRLFPKYLNIAEKTSSTNEHSFVHLNRGMLIP